jgi:hypothetical protein
MNQASSSMDGGSKGPPSYSTNPLATNISIMKGDAYIATRAPDYGMLEYVEKGKESTNPHVPLQIERKMGEIMTSIQKGAFNKDSHNLNAQAGHNYSVLEDLSQTPSAMSSLEVLGPEI